MSAEDKSHEEIVAESHEEIVAEMRASLPDGVTMHYTRSDIQKAMANPTPLCGANLLDGEPTESPSVGLTPIEEIVNCEQCKTLLAERAASGPIPITFDNNFATGHSDDCTDEDCALNNLTGIRGVEVGGEVYLSREDTLAAIGSLWSSTHNLTHKAEAKEGEEAQREAAFYGILTQGINMVGSLLHAQTRPENKIDTLVPDSLEALLQGNWGEGKPAAESAVDRMIREATEAAAAKRADANQSQEDQQ